MRSEFVDELTKMMRSDENIYVLLGDLGFGIFNNLRLEFPERCINVGSAEQLMIGIGCGMAMEGKRVVCYSITPFLIYRPFEFIRNYVNREVLTLKLVGSGRGQDYADAGFSHFSDEVESVLQCLTEIKQYYPKSGEELRDIAQKFIYENGPGFLSLKR